MKRSQIVHIILKAQLYNMLLDAPKHQPTPRKIALKPKGARQ